MDLGRQGARPEGLRLEARTAESGGGVLGEGQPAPSSPARGSGERCKLPCSAAKGFSRI